MAKESSSRDTERVRELTQVNVIIMALATGADALHWALSGQWPVAACVQLLGASASAHDEISAE